MRIVIAGCGKIGKAITGSLVADEHEVVVIDSKPEVIKTVSNTYDIMGICGSATDSDVLKDAGVNRAELFIALTGSDELNMLCCFMAKKLGAKHTVARIRDLENNDTGFDFMKQQLELSLSVNPELLTAEAIYQILKLPSAIKVETFSSSRMEMVELYLPQNTAVEGVSLGELRKKFKTPFLVSVVGRGDKVFIPGGDFALKAGAKIGLLAEKDDTGKILEILEIQHKKVKSVIIMGAGITSGYLASLLNNDHIEVKIIEKDEAVCEKMCEALPSGCTVVCGDGMSQDLLTEEGLDSADAFVALSGMSESNILISFYAMQKKVSKVISKVNRDELSGIAEKLGLECVVSPKSIVADVVLQYARALDKSSGDSQIETLYSVMGGLAEAHEFAVLPDFKFTDIPLKDLLRNSDILVAGIVRGHKAIIPGGDDVIKEKDKVIVITTTKNQIYKLSDVFRK